MFKDSYQNVQLIIKECNGIFKIKIIEKGSYSLSEEEFSEYKIFYNIDINITSTFLSFSYEEDRECIISFNGSSIKLPEYLKQNELIRKRFIPIVSKYMSLNGKLISKNKVSMQIPLNLAIISIIDIYSEEFKRNI